MIQKSIDDVRSLIQTNIEFLLESYDIKLIYIFGSYAKGNNNSNSDLDIAILLDRDFNPLDKLSLISEFTSIFKRDDIDLVILNSANPVLRHQVIKHGKIVYVEDENIKVNFEVRVLKEYMDMEPFRRVQTKSVEDWIEKSIGVDK
ncbi:type VII toxin-antitoxin system MntA family adenylyltransferase antitoxin [Clostridium sp. DL1XJH146]